MAGLMLCGIRVFSVIMGRDTWDATWLFIRASLENALGLEWTWATLKTFPNGRLLQNANISDIFWLRPCVSEMRAQRTQWGLVYDHTAIKGLV